MSQLFDFRETRTDFLLCVCFNINLSFVLSPHILPVPLPDSPTRAALITVSPGLHLCPPSSLSLPPSFHLSVAASAPLSASLFPTFIEKRVKTG